MWFQRGLELDVTFVQIQTIFRCLGNQDRIEGVVEKLKTIFASPKKTTAWMKEKI